MYYNTKYEEYEDMEENLPKKVKINKKQKFKDDNGVNWKQSKKYKSSKWNGNRKSIRNMLNE